MSPASFAHRPHRTTRWTSVRRVVSYPGGGGVRPSRAPRAHRPVEPVRNLARDLAPRTRSSVSYQMVLALWYSRAASGRCYSGATCHTSRGVINLKRSNRLVLLVGVFLAIVAFIGVILLMQGGDAGDRDDPNAIADRRPTRRRDRRHPARCARPGRPRQDRGQGRRRPPARLLQRHVPGHRQGRPRSRSPPASRSPADDLRLERRDHRHRSAPPCACAWRSRSTRSPASARSSRPATTSTWSWASPATSSRSSRSTRLDDTFTVVSGLNSTSVKALLQGLQVMGTLLPPPPAQDPNAPDARRRPEHGPQRPAADRHPVGRHPAVRGHQVRPAGRLDHPGPALAGRLHRPGHRRAAPGRHPGHHHRHHPQDPRRHLRRPAAGARRDRPARAGSPTP